MAIIKKDCEERIKSLAEGGTVMLDIIAGRRGEPRREGASYKCSCPSCGCDHSLVVTPGKNMFKCFNCNTVQGKGALAYLMVGEKMTYPQALEYLGNHLGIYVEREDPRPAAQKQPPKTKNFCDKMLKESGLRPEDVTATIVRAEDGQSTVVERSRTFIPGTVNSRGEIDRKGDDAVILYYDLDGREVTYTIDKDKTGATRKYFRVRYQFPDEHLDKKGRAMKYRSPAGSPTFLYFPEAVRRAYQVGETIETLYIQEGEKKAEKACKHGLLSVAVSGIQNLGLKGTLPEDIIRLISRCGIREVIFLLDSDCFDLTHNISIDDPIDRRPRNFFYAVRNYREYLNVLRNRNIFVEVYFGYVRKEASNGDKGIDDLLSNTLKGKEYQLLEDITAAKNEKDMVGQFVQLHKITTKTDAQIMDIWSLQSPQEFCNKYKDQLKDLPEFTFGKRRMRFSPEGNLESAQPVEPDEIFWTERTNDRTGEKEYKFMYTGAITFLERRGFYRYRKPSKDYEFIHVEKGVAAVMQAYEVSDYVKAFAKDCLNKGILEMLYRGGVQYLGPEKLGNLPFFTESFEHPARGVQHLFFANNFWQITADKIVVKSYSQLGFIIWDDMKKDQNASLLPPLIEIQKNNDIFSYTITDTGRQCDFLRFFENASNFTWRKERVTPEEARENAQHLVSKMAAFGYLINGVKDRSVAKAVVAMDGKQSEFGDSNGRSGKSLMGEAARKLATVKYFNGKDYAKQQQNQHIWDGITTKTGFLFIDDATRNIDFESLFSLITGDWPVNPKGSTPFELPFEASPKILVTTNFAISGDGSSFADRQWQLAFSDYYNDEHKPIHDFKVLFFDEWDADQWNLFWNFAATCLQVYFRFGYVPAPGDRLEVRKLMQEIGAEFDNWANAYYAPGTNTRLNRRLPRQEVYAALFEGAEGVKGIGHDRKTYYSPQNFKKRLMSWCKLHSYTLNPAAMDPTTGKYVKYDKDGRPLLDDKSNGIEYLTVGDENFNGGMGSFAPPSIFKKTESDEKMLYDSDDLPC